MTEKSLNSYFTLFTTFKPFEGESYILQTVAMSSWLKSNLPVIVFGNENGAEQAASKLGATLVSDVKRSEKNVPFISDMIKQAEIIADTPYIALINGDIVLDEKAVDAINQTIAFLSETDDQSKYLITTRRRNIPVTCIFDNPAQTVSEIHSIDEQYGHWDKDNAIDIFVFSKNLYDHVPNLAIGRSGWDNWLLWEATNKGAALIDLSLEASLKHPIHGYHGPMGGWANLMTNPDTIKNRELVEGKAMTFQDMTLCYHEGQVSAITSHLRRRITQHCAPTPELELKAGLRYLLSANLSNNEKLDVVKSFLWRLNIYFPLAEVAVNIGEHLQVAQEYCESADYDRAIFILQDMLCETLNDKIHPLHSKSERLFIWGAGGLGYRASTYLQNKHQDLEIVFIHKGDQISPMFDTDPNVIMPSDMYAQDKPLILIASIYVQEIITEHDELLKSINAKIVF